ncbi:MAG: DUF423 domain-containing protein [candidate division Zixibacteria bacterium]|nr:DUF423 domain-containing protein [candidate division Zixibacteria bacterium]
MTPDRLFILLGALSAFVGVAAGAFGAHALKTRLPVDLFDIFEVGVRYQMYHALGLLAIGLVISRQPSASLTVAGWMFVVGTIFFSGSLYVLSLTGIRWMGAITPLGGVAFLVGWVMLAYNVWKG